MVRIFVSTSVQLYPHLFAFYSRSPKHWMLNCPDKKMK
jgi:hypothetical protein